MLTGKQRVYLRKMANSVEPIFQIGKSGLTPEFTSAINDALEKRELIKISVLQNCLDDTKDMAGRLSDRTRSDVVHVIGRKITLYRASKENPKIELPK